MKTIMVPHGLLVSDNLGYLGSEEISRPIRQIETKMQEKSSRPRPRSITIGGLERTRITGHNFPNVNPIPIEPREKPIGLKDDVVDPLERNFVDRSQRKRARSLDTWIHPESRLSWDSSVPSSVLSFSSIAWNSSQSSTASARATRDEDPMWLPWDLKRYKLTNEMHSDAQVSLPRHVQTHDFAPVEEESQDPSTVRAKKILPMKKNSLLSVKDRASIAISSRVRHSSLYDLYEVAKKRQQRLRRSPWIQNSFEYFIYFIILAVIYFVFVGLPFWKGAVYWLYWVVDHKFIIAGGWAITIGLAILYAFGPLLIFFEKNPPPYDPTHPPEETTVALIIPCYKSAAIIGPTLQCALKVFPAKNIFVIANGNSPTPLDDTAGICASYGVNHTWSPIGSKIIAQFIGCYVSKAFPYSLLIDDDCHLPSNFPLRTNRLKHKVKCLGYTIKSVGVEGSRGTLTQRAQDLEYKVSGLQRAFAGKLGSATFPHGAISLWDRKFLLKTFYEHPGFSVSEDWFFGHVARSLGSRIVMDTEVFVETETPSAIFWAGGGGTRGGFGEMTVWKQRFQRWNFFFVNGIYWNMRYIICDWKLGWWEVGAKLFVFQEVYETLLYLLAPFVIPVSFVVRPAFCGYLLASTFFLYLINTVLFNEIHLRRKEQRVDTLAVLYYFPYKIILTVVNILSCYWSIFKYARYFAKRHPKVVEDEKVVEVALRIEEEASGKYEGQGKLHTPWRQFSVVVETVVHV